MCNDVLRDKIIAKVNALTAANVMFTAWDVTRLLRQDGEYVKHYETKEVVEELFNDEDIRNASEEYFRTSICVDPNKGVYAYVYHRAVDDPYTYDPNGLTITPTAVVNQPTVTPSPVAPTPAVSTLTPINVTPAGDGVLHTDTRGRLLIPKKIVNEAGFKVGDVVYAYIGMGGDLCVSKYANPQDRSYIVDKYDDLRIKPSLLGMNETAFTATVFVAGNVIFVRPA